MVQKINNLNNMIIRKDLFFIFIMVFSIITLHAKFAMSAKNVQKSNSKEGITNISKTNTIFDQSTACLIALHRKYPQVLPEMFSDKEKLVAVLENLYKTNSNDENITLVYACMLADINNLTKANEIINKIRDPNKHSNLYYYYDAKIAMGIGDLKRAELSFKHLKYPHSDPDVWHLGGLLISIKGDEKQSKQVWEALLKKYPGNGLTYYDLGVAYTILKEYDNAIKSFQKAWEFLGINYRKEKQKARLQQAYIELIIFNDKETGAEHLQEAIDLAPNSIEVKDFYATVGYKNVNFQQNDKDTISPINTSGLEVSNFKFGILSKVQSNKYTVIKEAITFKKQEELIYGFTYDFIKRKAQPIQEKIILRSPSTPSVFIDAGSDTVSESVIKDASGPWCFGKAIDKNDPLGKYSITIKHDEAIFKVIEYTIE